ncbi:PaaI family thioesterase [Halioxenophilus aromaticivorans]|uniref:PaaI family thioesterase n=1 Tax=Halioxenophilus aromaticivorans TaxID=1306992 RepID=A0AAV3U784_9ALTE
MKTIGDSAQQSSSPTEKEKECADWQALLERIPYAQHLGLEVQRDDAVLLVHMPCREALIGNFMLPALHGGVLGALIELTARVAAQSQDTGKRCPRILDSHINYLRSAKARSTFASAEIVRQGRRTSLVRVICWQGDKSKLIASGQVQLLLPTIAPKQEDLHEQQAQQT